MNTKVLYKQDGKRFEVESFVYFPKHNEWFVQWYNIGFNHNDVTSEMLLSPTESWEQIEHDATLAPRDYLQARGIEERKDGRIATMMADLVSRAKALAEMEKTC